MDTDPFFSVVTPVYNRETLIRDTINSVLEQTFPDYEIIVVDDGSTDGTLQTLASYGDAITIIKQKNQGPGSARNAGIETAKGEYIAFLDSDDCWFPWSLESYFNTIQNHDIPAFVAGNPYLFTDSSELPDSCSSLQTQHFSDYLASGDEWRWWGVSSFVVKTEALKEVGGFVSQRINAEDHDLALRLGTHSGFVDIDGSPTFAYRQHEGTARDDHTKTARGSLQLVRSEYEQRYPGGKARQKERWRILTRQVRPAALGCLRHGLWEEAWTLYRKTLPWHFALHRWKFVVGFLGRSVQYRIQDIISHVKMG